MKSPLKFCLADFDIFYRRTLNCESFNILTTIAAPTAPRPLKNNGESDLSFIVTFGGVPAFQWSVNSNQ